MRIFQNSGVYRSYRPRLAGLTRDCKTFSRAIDAFLDDRFGAAHFLQPVLTRDETAFFANGDDEFSQRLWAKANGLPGNAAPDDILRAQIEQHRTEVFYNTDPMRYGDEFLAKMPGSVRRTIAWRAAPSAGGRFLKHDIIVNNFPTLLDQYRTLGARTEYFSPAHDPVMDEYATGVDRPIDVLFVGSYSRHHRNRARMLEAVAALRLDMNVVMHLDRSRLTRLAETPLGWVGPLAKHRRNQNIRAVACGPIFGRALLAVIGKSKIVVNGAIDMAGSDRGNMRVWEAMGCGAALVSDAGHYPDGIVPHDHFVPYTSADDVVVNLRRLHGNDTERATIGAAGHAMIAARFSKRDQWARFVEIAS